MEREGGTGAPDPTTAIAVPSVSSGSLQPCRAKVQAFNQFSKSSVLPASGAVAGTIQGFSMGGPVGAVIGGTLGSMAGGALTAQTPAERQETMGYAFQAAQLGGQFTLAMTKLQMEFIGALTGMALQEGNEQARKWADWYFKIEEGRVSEPVRQAITNPVVINEYMHGDRPQLSNDANEQNIAMRMLENLRRIRGEDTASFDAMLGGQTQDPQLVRAYIDHENGRRYDRGLKPMNALTALERWSMGLQLSEKERKHLANRQRRPVEG